MLNGQTFSSRTGKTSGLPKFELNASGIRVYGAGASTVKENLFLLSENKLQELSAYNACRAHQGGCGHQQE